MVYLWGHIVLQPLEAPWHLAAASATGWSCKPCQQSQDMKGASCLYGGGLTFVWAFFYCVINESSTHTSQFLNQHHTACRAFVIVKGNTSKSCDFQ
jgi:hypothetical protein